MGHPEDDGPELERLLERARSGDARALGELLRVDRDRLKRLADQRLPAALRGRIDGSDVVQKAQLAAFQEFGDFRGTTIAQFRDWCRQILEHDILGILEREKHAAKRSIDREEDAPNRVAEAAGSQTSPSQRAVRNEHRTILLEAIDALERPMRDVMSLRHLQELTLDEIMVRTGLSSREVSALLHRGMREVKARLKRHGLADP